MKTIQSILIEADGVNDVDLLQEFAEYGINLKAKIVYRKCLQNRKFHTAKRIKIKYKLVNKHDDCVIALGFALMAQSNKF